MLFTISSRIYNKIAWNRPGFTQNSSNRPSPGYTSSPKMLISASRIDTDNNESRAELEAALN